MLKRMLYSYGYLSVHAFAQSLFPSTKYVSPACTVGISSVLGAVAAMMGLWPFLLLAMVLVMTIELVSGLMASHVRKEKFESAKFSRFVLKLCIWFILFVSVQLFAIIARHEGTMLIWELTGTLFDVITIILMVCFLVENVTSILENLSCIDGKDKSYYIDLIMDAVGIAFKKIGLKKDKEDGK